MKLNNVVQSDRILFRRILIATDFSDASRNALRYAAAIARGHGARLYVVHVVSSVGYRMAGADAEIQAAELAARELKELWSKLCGSDLLAPAKLALIVRRGEVCDQLEDLVQKKQIDLVVVGTRGRTGLSKVVLGSVAEDIFRKVSCPVLTVGPSSDQDWAQREVGAEEAILFATDFGDASLKALPYAVSIAHRSRSKLFLLNVTEPPDTQMDQAPNFGNTLEVVGQGFRESAMKRLKKLIPDDLKVDHEIRVTCSPPVDGILGEAAHSAAGLIVLGLHRKSLFVPSGHLPSSTAYEVVLRAQCPVLTVRS
jgi:nucleotide-binding universal stress UspA family protein